MFDAYRNLKSRASPRLARHIVIVLLVKIVLLTLLWHVFIKPHRVAVDIESMGGRMAGSSAPLSKPLPSSSLPEKTHDRLDRR